MKLNEISDNPEAKKNAKRVGRGIGSGKGKTCGRGHKGQKSRSGVALNGFEGGQLQLFMRHPKRGFSNPFPNNFRIVNVGRLQAAIDNKKLSKGADVTEEILSELGLAGKGDEPIRLLGQGTLKDPLNITVTYATPSAVKAVEKAGGKVTILKKA
ncbi:MAG: 50S ribosomal protein L15 [Alphaproteobacteria bacterium]